MFAGVALLAIAFATIFATIVAILRIDNSGIGKTAGQRLWLILTAWLFDAHPDRYGRLRSDLSTRNRGQ
jgi:hypothetical protein